MNDDHDRDAAAEAFDALRTSVERQGEEIALLCQAIRGLAESRVEVPELPDYSETLGLIATDITAVTQHVNALAEAAKGSLTPAAIVNQIVAESGPARAGDEAAMMKAQKGLEDVTRKLQGHIDSASNAIEQKQDLVRTGLGGIAIGALLWSVLPGMVARELPTSWQAPEWMAARMLRQSKWAGGMHMMQAGAPVAFNNLVANGEIIAANNVVLEACRKRAVRIHKTARCFIKVEPDYQGLSRGSGR